MKNSFALRCTICVVLFILACGGDSGKSTGSTAGSGGQSGAMAGAGAGNGGGAGTMDTTDGPAITSAPADWMPPADCGGVGDLCDFLSCGERAICQSLSNTCIPALAQGAQSTPLKTKDTPYCAAYTCMTFEEASCFCSGPAGMTEAGCSSPGALAGLCVGKQQSCGESACCDGLSCIEDGFGGKVCEESCNDAKDCDSGCCTDVHEVGTKVCAVKSACDNPCKRFGEACANDCCRYACVQSDDPNVAGCRATCTTNDDCDTHCCLAASNGSLGTCAPDSYCGCGAAGAHCGSDTKACCDGTQCVGSTAETLSCHQVCKENADCPTQCCSAVTGADYNVCEDPSYCP
jgi:hypothetical protein